MDALTRIAILLSCALLAGCGSGAGTDAGDKADPVAQVRTSPVTTGGSADGTVLYGAAEAGPGASQALTAPTEAIVDRIVAPTGTEVRAGAIIATLKPSRATAASIGKGAADLVQANAAYQRALRLRADGLVSDGDVETARTAAQTARAVVAGLGMVKGDEVLRAPVGGIVQGLTAKTGDQLAAGTSVASIAGHNGMRAHFSVDPALVHRIHAGQSLTLESLSGDAHATVQVAGIDPQVDPATRLAAVYARLPDGFHAGPGEALRGTVALATQANGVTIPYAALLDDGGHSFVFVVRAGVAHRRDVSPGSSGGDRIRILNGLAVGDRVVTEGGTALEDGMKVTEQAAAR